MFRMLCKIVVVACLSVLAVSAAAADSPQVMIRATIEKTLTVLQDPGIQGADQRPERLRKLEAVILPHFDTVGMAQRSLGPYWRQLTDNDRKEFLTLFTALVEHTYGSTIDRYAHDIQVSYDQERIDGDFAEVDTHVRAPAQDHSLPVNYFLHSVNGQWLIYDMQIDNVSLVMNYRAQFNRVLSTSSVGDLMSRLRQTSQKLHSSAS